MKPEPNAPAVMPLNPAVPPDYATASVQRGHAVVTEIGDDSITARAERIRHNTDEDMVWQAKPSMLLIVWPAIRCLVMITIVLSAALWTRSMVVERADVLAAAASHGARPAVARKANSNDTMTPGEAMQAASYILYAALAVVAALLAKLGVLWLRLKTTRYWATSQRLMIESGILKSVNVPFELHRLSNALIVRPLLLRPFGLGSIVVAMPKIELAGIRNPDYVRDVLRNAGQLEAQRMDKIRWR